MTEISLVDRLRENFGEAAVRGLFPLRRLSNTRARELASHQRWVRSSGRFGHPVTWQGVNHAFCKANYAAEDFSHITLIDCAFEWSDLRCATFANATLTNVRFRHCDLEQCNFAGARLNNVFFDDCFDLERAEFDSAVPAQMIRRTLRSGSAHEQLGTREVPEV